MYINRSNSQGFEEFFDSWAARIWHHSHAWFNGVPRTWGRGHQWLTEVRPNDVQSCRYSGQIKLIPDISETFLFLMRLLFFSSRVFGWNKDHEMVKTVCKWATYGILGKDCQHVKNDLLHMDHHEVTEIILGEWRALLMVVYQWG